MRIYYDSWLMFKRSLLISARNPETIVMAIVTPFLLMVLFGTIFGNIADVGDYNYIDFIVPGIILQAVAQASQFTAINVTNDMTKGMVDRFRSMPLSMASVLIGHAAASIVRNIFTTVIIIATAFLVGFRPNANALEWLVVAGIFVLAIIAISWFAVLCGMIAKAPETSAGLMLPLFILPFISSGFAPTEALPSWLRWFAENQPMSPVIDSTRSLMMDMPLGNSLTLSIIWCVGITVIVFALSLYKIKRFA
ncbi:MAG: ABC transporter permease [Defluviitaleaceae bacterium]|nr:ABC transporter permease [Defluviitaleaceae bacterium]